MLQSIMICMRLCLYYIIFEWVYQLMSIITRHYDLITLYGCFCNALQTFCKMLPCEKHFAKYYKYKLKKRKWRCQFVNCTEYSLLHRKGSCPVTDKCAWKTLFSKPFDHLLYYITFQGSSETQSPFSGICTGWIQLIVIDVGYLF